MSFKRKVKSYFDTNIITKKYVRRIIDPVEYYREDIELLSRYSKKIDCLLDVGCGSARFLEAFQKSMIVERLYGIDFSK